MAPHATDCPRETEVGQPSTPPWEVADIFRLYGETYRRAHPVSPAQRQVMHAIEACRTAQLGGHAEHCPTCGFERYVYNSCRNRHCPKCQTFPKAQWIEARKAELLPVPYFHLVFTVPHALNALILVHKRPLLTLLFNAASQNSYSLDTATSAGRSGARWSCTPGIRPWGRTSMSTASSRLARLPPTGSAGSRLIPASSSRCGP